MTQQEPQKASSTWGAPSVRTLINIGVFAAIYFALSAIGVTLGLLGPVAMALGLVVGVFLNGTVVMLLVARNPSMWVLTIFAAVIGILMGMSGHFPPLIIVAILLGFIADLIVRAGKYRSRVNNIIANGVLHIWMIGPFIPMLIHRDTYLQKQADGNLGAHAEAFMSLTVPSVFAIFMTIILVMAIAGAWVGTYLVDKHFARAGVA